MTPFHQFSRNPRGHLYFALVTQVLWLLVGCDSGFDSCVTTKTCPPPKVTGGAAGASETGQGGTGTAGGRDALGGTWGGAIMAGGAAGTLATGGGMPTGAGGGCATDAQCSAAEHCESNRCVPDLAERALCSRNEECGSGACVACYTDADNDTFGSSAAPTMNCDLCPAGRVSNSLDCSDNDVKVKPGASEALGDGVDQDCDGKETCFVDADKDGLRTEVTSESTNGKCDPADGYALASAEVDCDDTSAGFQRVCQISVGSFHACAILNGGRARCWGYNNKGQLGYANVLAIGDDETPASAGDVNVGGLAAQISTGREHTCVRFKDSTVRCWGSGDFGRLGYGNADSIGDNEYPSSHAVVNVGANLLVQQIATGYYHTCSLLSNGKVRCWGRGDLLGYGNTNNVYSPSAAGDLGLLDIRSISAGSGGTHTCALSGSGTVKCWGTNGSGQLGYGNTNNIGDDETAATAFSVDVGGAVTQVAAGTGFTCALLIGGKVRCWGDGTSGQLGYVSTDNIGDNETPASKGDVNVGGVVLQLAVGSSHVCALLEGGKVRCWGSGSFGALGYASLDNIGDNETPASRGDVDVGGAAVQLSAGSASTCAILTGSRVRCWGNNFQGELGYGNKNNIGDDEAPASAGDVPLF